MRKLVIFGGSGIGMIAADIARITEGYTVEGFLNDSIEKGKFIGKYEKIKVLGPTDRYMQYLKDPDIYFFMAYVGMTSEEKTYKKLLSIDIPDHRWATLIHPTAVYPKGFCGIEYGVLMGPHSQISPDVYLSRNVILLGGAFVGHDSTLQRFAHVATNGVVGANVEVGRACHIGSNSTIREKVKIGDFSLIGSGSVVLKDVPPKTIYVGNPAKILS